MQPPGGTHLNRNTMEAAYTRCDLGRRHLEHHLPASVAVWLMLYSWGYAETRGTRFSLTPGYMLSLLRSCFDPQSIASMRIHWLRPFHHDISITSFRPRQSAIVTAQQRQVVLAGEVKPQVDAL